MINKTIDKNYNDIGPQLNISIQLFYKDLTVLKYPESCCSCPVGFSHNINCGRNVPLKNEDYHKRPDTCKLKLVNISDIISEGDLLK